MDIIITNSTNTQKRLKKFTGYDSTIIYPPVDIERFKKNSAIPKKHYLSFSRLANIKRVDTIVKAFQGLPEKTLVFTYGNNDPDKEKVLKLCEGYKNIIPILSPDDRELQTLIQGAIATLSIPIDEDFGMMSVESQACGVPVIGVRDGGLLETVIDGKTGILIGSEADVGELRQAVLKLDITKANAMEFECIVHANSFSSDTFGKALKNILQ